jgi:hypothetical protein
MYVVKLLLTASTVALQNLLLWGKNFQTLWQLETAARSNYKLGELQQTRRVSLITDRGVKLRIGSTCFRYHFESQTKQYLGYVSPCSIIHSNKSTNHMHQSLRFIARRSNTAQHVSGILMPIVRSLSTAVAASGLPLERGGSSAVGRGRSDRTDASGWLIYLKAVRIKFLEYLICSDRFNTK